MNRFANNQKAGMTLLELIIYSAISSLLVSVILLSAYPLINNAGKNSELMVKNDEVVFILGKLDWLFSSGVTRFEILENQSSFRLENETQEFLLENKDDSLYLNDQALSSSHLKVNNLSLALSDLGSAGVQYLTLYFLLDEEENISRIFKLYLK